MSSDEDRKVPFSFGSDPAATRGGARSVPGWLKGVALLALLAAAAGVYLYVFDRDLGRRLLADTPVAPAPSVTTFYRWRDADGGIHLTDRPPPEGTPYETVQVSGDANVVPSRAPAPR